eukprot:765013-Hanusia_phi.AAC.2
MLPPARDVDRRHGADGQVVVQVDADGQEHKTLQLLPDVALPAVIEPEAEGLPEVPSDVTAHLASSLLTSPSAVEHRTWFPTASRVMRDCPALPSETGTGTKLSLFVPVPSCPKLPFPTSHALTVWLKEEGLVISSVLNRFSLSRDISSTSILSDSFAPSPSSFGVLVEPFVSLHMLPSDPTVSDSISISH